VAARYWSCRKCGYRNERAHLICRGIYLDQMPCPGRRPARKVPKHAVVLRDQSFEHFLRVNDEIHGQGECCGVCGTPPKDGRNLQREHDHVSGLARGLACWRCNRLMPKQFGLVEARAIVAYLERFEIWRAAHYVREAGE
jgi:hypothetical protein